MVRNKKASAAGEGVIIIMICFISYVLKFAKRDTMALSVVIVLSSFQLKILITFLWHYDTL